MRRGDHDPRVTVEMPDGEREQGGRTRLSEEEDVEAGGGEDPGAQLGELRRMVPRIVRDHARPRRSVALAGGDIVGQSARALGDRPFVEDIGADRVHLPAAAARAELEDRVKGVVELGHRPLLDVLEQPIRDTWRTGLRSASGGHSCRRRGGKPSFGSGLPEPFQRLVRCDHCSAIPRGRFALSHPSSSG